MIRSTLLLLLAALPAHSRGGGGCLAGGTQVATPDGPRLIESLRRGDLVLAADGRTSIPVVDTVRVVAEVFVELRTAAETVSFTPEHLVQTAPGVFKQAGVLKAGDTIVTRGGASRLRSARRLRRDAPAYNLTAASPQTFLAGGVAVHNKGCFLPETDILDADGRKIPLGRVKVGDRLLAHTPEGGVVQTTVREVFSVVEPAYFEVEAGDIGVKATAEHPFYVGAGSYKTVAALKPGDTVYLFDGKTLAPRQVSAKRLIDGSVTVYNLRTDHPNSFFANGFAVHNKGGGCFVGGTKVYTGYGRSPIEDLHPGETVLAFSNDGVVTPTKIREIYSLVSAEIYEIRAGGKTARASGEHPFYTGGGVFKTIAELVPGEVIYLLDGYRMRPTRIDSVQRLQGSERVYNLRVDAPNTFFAESFAVHNKGGSSRSSSSRSSRSSSSRSSSSRSSSSRGSGYSGGGGGGDDGAAMFAILSLSAVFGVMILMHGRVKFGQQDNLDYSFPRSQVAWKSAKTRKLLEFLAKSDADMAPDTLAARAQVVFLKMQEHWQERDHYAPMEPMLMPALYREHLVQLRGLAQAHEFDKIEGVKVHWVELVHVRYPHDREKREFTALIEAEAKDWYADDRTGAYLRGDTEPATFQEFWTFQWEVDGWRLRQIEQTRESDALREENFVETFTPDQLGQVYGEAPGTTAGPVGTWRDSALEAKENRIARLLNFLVKTDKVWNEDAMKERVRETFMAVQGAIEQGQAEPAQVLLAPEVYTDLERDIASRRANNLKLLMRNLCVRKVDILLVRNAADDGRDEFVARIAAHAQKTVLKGETKVFEQEFVTPYEEYWTFGRDGGAWRLKESLPPAQGGDIVTSENVYQEASADQLQWMYTKERAM